MRPKTQEHYLWSLNSYILIPKLTPMLLRINPDNPQLNKIEQAVECLRKGGLIIYPTDTVYGIGCDIHNQRAVERLCQLKGIKPNKAQFAFICHDLSHISDYTRHLDTPVFKVMKKALPGPYTFILDAGNKVPKSVSPKKKTVGIRVPDNNIPREIVRILGNPIVTTSLKDDDDIVEYTTDPELIYERYEKLVDIVIDGGFGQNVASTVVDCTGGDIEVIRQGLGDLEAL